MKRTSAILLLIVLLFNWVGYKFITSYLEDEAVEQMQLKIDDDNYSDDDLISFKIPFNISYGTYSTQFEKVDGTVDINGITYQYVKRRYYNDTLELLCIPNIKKTSITNIRNEIARQAADFLNLSTSKKSTSNHNQILVKYSVQDITDKNYFNIDIVSFKLGKAYELMNDKEKQSRFLLTLTQPPETL